MVKSRNEEYKVVKRVDILVALGSVLKEIEAGETYANLNSEFLQIRSLADQLHNIPKFNCEAIIDNPKLLKKLENTENIYRQNYDDLKDIKIEFEFLKEKYEKSETTLASLHSYYEGQ